MSVRVYKQLDDLYGTKEIQLNTQGVVQWKTRRYI